MLAEASVGERAATEEKRKKKEIDANFEACVCCFEEKQANHVDADGGGRWSKEGKS